MTEALLEARELHTYYGMSPERSTMGGNFQPHQGVEFNNPDGTPVHAIGDGVVVHAGPAEQGGLRVDGGPKASGSGRCPCWTSPGPSWPRTTSRHTAGCSMRSG